MFPVSVANFIVVSMYWDQILLCILNLIQFNPHSRSILYFQPEFTFKNVVSPNFWYCHNLKSQMLYNVSQTETGTSLST